MKPLFLIKPGTVTAKDIRRAEKACGICFVECKEPEAARFLDPPPTADLTQQARAALHLMRRVFAAPTANLRKDEMLQWFVNEIVRWDDEPVRVPPVKEIAAGGK